MAITQNYVDYGAGNDTTGDGTIGTPWKTLQKAFDTLTRNATDGNQVNLKAGTAHANAAALDLATFIAGGALANSAPLIIRGYTSAANDGGIAEIDCNGATMWAATSYDYIVFIDLKMHNFGNTDGIYLDDDITFLRCEVYKGASSPTDKRLIRADSRCRVIGCYIHDNGAGGAYGVSLGVNSLAYGNYMAQGTASGGIGIYMDGGVALSNIVLCGAVAQYGISIATGGIAVGNICYNTTAGTAVGLSCPSSHVANLAMNNIVVGWSGAGGRGIEVANVGALGYNAFYNNTTPVSVTDQKFLDLTALDVTLAADPFTSAATGDFSLTAAAKTALAAKGWPAAYLGAHASTIANLNIGSIQMAAAVASGGAVAISPAIGRFL